VIGWRKGNNLWYRVKVDKAFTSRVQTMSLVGGNAERKKKNEYRRSAKNKKRRNEGGWHKTQMYVGNRGGEVKGTGTFRVGEKQCKG